MKICYKCEDVFVTIVGGVFSGSELCPTCSNTTYKKTEGEKMNNNKEAISNLIDRTEDKLKKYKTMSNLKTSKCILTEALQDSLSMALWLEDSLDKKGFIMNVLMKMEMEKK